MCIIHQLQVIVFELEVLKGLPSMIIPKVDVIKVKQSEPKLVR